ncbi:MAG: Glycosyltransferase involved in cell wall bisynthesis [Thermodesulfobacteria bacterium]|nr:Glycosyltransferase involved in cell wall bisynthesis [Thermodesulfobacteriota bacterium]
MKANVVIVPMRMGSGMKNKILEAMALQKPIVCTSLAAESLDKECQKILFIGDTPEVFANKIIMLLKDKKKRKEVGLKGRELVKEIYSWERSAEKYCKLYEKLIKKYIDDS